MDPITGRMAVVFPWGALFRGGAGVKIRRNLLEMDLIEAVINALPEAIADFKSVLATVRDTEDNLRRTIEERGWLDG